MKLQIVLGCAAALLLAASCKNPVPQELPIVQTGEVVVSDSGVVLYGRIVQAGMAEIESYGFSIDTAGTFLNRIIVSKPAMDGVFWTKIEGFADTQRTYYIHAFLMTEEGEEVYGNRVSFRQTSALGGGASLSVDRFFPALANIGDSIHIEGIGFTIVPDLSDVFVEAPTGSRYSLRTVKSSYRSVTAMASSSLPVRGRLRLGVTVEGRTAHAPGFLQIGYAKIDSIVSPHRTFLGEYIIAATSGISPQTYVAHILGLEGEGSFWLEDVRVNDASGLFSGRITHAAEGTYALRVNNQIYANDSLKVATDIGHGGTVPGAFSCQSLAFAAGNHAYVVVVENNRGSFWRYDPSSFAWERLPDCPFLPHVGIESFQLDGKVYLAGGFSVFSGGNWIYQSRTVSYDPSTGVWADKGAFPAIIRDGPFAFAHNGYGYWGGGKIGNIYRNDFWRYDPVQNTWTALASIAPNVRGVVVNNIPYLIGAESLYRLTSSDSLVQMPYRIICGACYARHAIAEGDHLRLIFDNRTSLRYDPAQGEVRMGMNIQHSANYAFSFGRRAVLMLTAPSTDGMPSPSCEERSNIRYYDF